ncbi:MAG: hypothetical protein WC962_05660 [Phycisphaerae bacterium]|jgi:hypothetical protein
MTSKAIYKHKQSGDLFAIETDGDGNIVSTSGPLLSKDLDPKHLDYDCYWNDDVRTNLDGFELLSKLEYLELLRKTGFYMQQSQRSIFEQMKEK